MLCCVVCYFVVTTSNRIAYMRTRNIDACWVKRKRISDLQLLVVAVLYSNKFLNKPKPSVCVCVCVCGWVYNVLFTWPPRCVGICSSTTHMCCAFPHMEILVTHDSGRN